MPDEPVIQVPCRPDSGQVPMNLISGYHFSGSPYGYLTPPGGQMLETFFAYCSQLQTLVILEQLPPPGELLAMAQSPSVGYRWIRLDPQAPKTSCALQISGPDQCGRRRQVPGGPEPGHPQGLIFWKSC